MEHNKKLRNLDSIAVFVLGLFLIVFPLAFSTLTTDAFVLPKQIVLGGAVLASLLLFALKLFFSRTLKIARSPFDIPLLIFGGVVFISSLLAVNRADALTNFFPFLLGILIYFCIINVIKSKSSLTFLVSSLTLGASIVSVLTVLYFLKIYLLPVPLTNTQTFSAFGSLFDQAIYLGLIASFLGYMLYPIVKSKQLKGQNLLLIVGFAVVVAGFAVTIYEVLTLQKPNILPFATGFQTAFAAISQDTQRTILSFLFGSGIGTYLTDFTRFKQATFNLNPNLWNLYFFRSSSFALELLATTGVLGFSAFLLLVVTILRSGRNYVPLVLAIVLAFLLPMPFTALTLFFILLGLFAAFKRNVHEHREKYHDVEFGIVAANENSQVRNIVAVLPMLFLFLILLFSFFTAYLSLRYVISDMTFQKSFSPQSQANGTTVYQLQAKGIQTFGNRDGYHRVFSQTNLALANNIAANVPKGSSPSAQTQQTIYTLIQQSINSGRAATTVAPQTSINWDNLSSIYRSLIGFGQNADNFAVLASQQAIYLDPSNPQEYINLGGIFFQLKQWDSAIKQFQTAISLKPDYANAYYNLGHAYEEKGDLQNALTTYQTVKNLTVNDKASLKKINAEIDALQKRIGSSTEGGKDVGTAENQPPINLTTPAAQLPPQDPPVKIPAPQTSPAPSPTPQKSPVPSPTPQI